MLRRLHHYTNAHPLTAWLMMVFGCLAAFAAVHQGFSLWHDNRGMTGFSFVMAVSLPTSFLVRRFTDDALRTNPVSPSQTQAVGGLSLAAAVLSIGAWGFAIVEKRMGLSAPQDTNMAILLVFSLSALLSVAFGWAARSTKIGRIGLFVSTVWLLLIVCTGAVLLALSWPRS